MARSWKWGKKKSKAGKEESEYLLTSWSQLHDKAQLVSWWHGTALAGHNKQLSLGMIHSREDPWVSFISLVQVNPAGMNSPSLPGCVTWSALDSSHYGAVFPLGLKVVGRARDSLGVVRVSMGYKDASTMAGSQGPGRTSASPWERQEVQIN